MSNYANIDGLIGLEVQVHDTGHEIVDMPGVVEAAWITQDDHVKVLLRLTNAGGSSSYGEFLMTDLKFTKYSLAVSAQELLVAKTRKIEAIKMYRERTGVGLKEAKDAVEEAMSRTFGYKVPPCPYCGQLGCNLGWSCPGNPANQPVMSLPQPMSGSFTTALRPCPHCGSTNHTANNCAR